MVDSVKHDQKGQPKHAGNVNKISVAGEIMRLLEWTSTKKKLFNKQSSTASSKYIW